MHFSQPWTARAPICVTVSAAGCVWTFGGAGPQRNGWAPAQFWSCVSVQLRLLMFETNVDLKSFVKLLFSSSRLVLASRSCGCSEPGLPNRQFAETNPTCLASTVGWVKFWLRFPSPRNIVPSQSQSQSLIVQLRYILLWFLRIFVRGSQFEFLSLSVWPCNVPEKAAGLVQAVSSAQHRRSDYLCPRMS